MPKRNCPNNRLVGFSVPGPLYSRVDRRGGTAEPAAESVEIIRTTVAPAGLEEPQMCRYPHLIPQSVSAAENEMACLLRQQNTLLCALLEAVNSLLADRLSDGGGAD